MHAVHRHTYNRGIHMHDLCKQKKHPTETVKSAEEEEGEEGGGRGGGGGGGGDGKTVPLPSGALAPVGPPWSASALASALQPRPQPGSSAACITSRLSVDVC